ncbi:MAG: hypothetical protein ACXAC8_05475 [Candidatus Hodarchaeales archaeon]
MIQVISNHFLWLKTMAILEEVSQIQMITLEIIIDNEIIDFLTIFNRVKEISDLIGIAVPENDISKDIQQLIDKGLIKKGSEDSNNIGFTT